MHPYDYKPPLVTGIESDSNQYNECGEFNESFENSENNFSSNRDDLKEYKASLTFPVMPAKNN